MRTLSGDLADFSVRDVLRFLSSTGSSGMLLLHSASGDAGVFFRDGGICLALMDIARVPLGPRLTTMGLADKAAVDAASRVSDGTAFGLACGLMRTVGDAAAATALVADHTAETIAWLSLGSATAFEFDSTVTVDDWPLEPLGTDEVLGDVERRAWQWTDVRAVISDLSLVPSCMPDPPDPAEIELTAWQWRIVALVDGHRSLNDVLHLVGLGQLDASGELVGLVKAGLVELVAPGGHSIVDALVHDVRAAGPFAISQPWFARGDGVRAAPQPPAAGGSQGPEEASGTVDDAAQPLEPDAASDANLSLLSRLINGDRGT